METPFSSVIPVVAVVEVFAVASADQVAVVVSVELVEIFGVSVVPLFTVVFVSVFVQVVVSVFFSSFCPQLVKARVETKAKIKYFFIYFLINK